MRIVYSFVIGFILMILSGIGMFIFPIMAFFAESVSEIGEVSQSPASILLNSLATICLIVLIVSPILFWIMIPLNNKFHFFKKMPEKKIDKISVPQNQKEVKYCTYCGAENPSSSKFCIKCGKKY